MALTLQIISNQSATLGSESCKVFGKQGGTIGRVEGNNWVLPDPERYVSSQHAMVTFQDGNYFITDTSTNGVYINDSDEPVGPDNTVMLNSGDRLFVGDYEILVRVDTTEINESKSDFFTAKEEYETNSPTNRRLEGQAQVIPPFETSASGYGSEPEPLQEPIIGEDFFNEEPQADHISPEQQFFEPPQSYAEQIPEDWDLTKTNFETKEVEQQGVVSESELIPEPEVVPSPPAQPVSPSQQQAERPIPPPRIQAEVAPATATEKMDANAAIQALLEGAGITQPQSVDDPEEMLRNMGQIYREVVVGMMEVLSARSQMKSEFRMALTTIRPVENNPLKFSVGADEALEVLLVKGGAGYLPPVEAFQQGLQDIKDHEMAMIAGMRAAFDALLDRFEPERLQADFDRGAKGGGMLVLNKKARYWEQYLDFYEDLVNQAEDHFQGLFGEEFGRAYEEQMYHLSVARKKEQ